ncbi:MAG TPA: PLP-dependent aminotransferase family protein [Acidimicrobiales bacterium]
MAPPEQDLVARLGDWTRGTGPLYARLADAIGRLVDSGVLAPGTLLPPERRLAPLLHVSRTTVVAAYDRLKRTGRLVSRQGSGTRVAPNVGGPVGASAVVDRGPNDVFRSLLADPDATIDLSAACPPVSPVVVEALAGIDPRELVALTSSHGYQPAGLPALRQAVADHLTATGLATTADEVIVTTGAQQAISLVASLFVRPGDAVLVEEATYPGALDAFRAAGARLVAVPLDEGGLRVDAVADLVDRAQPRLLYTVPTYQNPTASVMDSPRRRSLARLASAAGVPIVEDTAIADLHLSGPVPPPPIAAFDGDAVLCVGSLGKVLWGGLRVGWVRAPEATVARLARLRAVADLGGPLLSQAIGARLVSRIDEAVRHRTEHLLKSRDRLAAELSALLPEWAFRVPDGGTVLWARLPAGDARSFAQVALRFGVAIVAGPALSPTGGFTDHVRIPFIAEPDALGEAVRRLAAAWRAYAPGVGTDFTSEPVLG